MEIDTESKSVRDREFVESLSRQEVRRAKVQVKGEPMDGRTMTGGAPVNPGAACGGCCPPTPP